MKFDSIPEVLEELKAGRMIILVDDEDRENEGDFVMAAQYIQPEHITTMIRQASGIITVPMPASHLHRLQIELMVSHNRESMGTAFTVTVDAKNHISTGSSAWDRAYTTRLLADPNSMPEDFSRPGHVNPLLARPGGVLQRAGHTEAAVDLMTLAGLQPVGVLCEIMDDQGEMTRLPGLRELAQKLQLKITSIAELIRYRSKSTSLVRETFRNTISLNYGPFEAVGFECEVSGTKVTALVRGNLSPSQEVLVRMHSLEANHDLFTLICSPDRHHHKFVRALETIGKSECAALIIIESDSSGMQLFDAFKAQSPLSQSGGNSAGSARSLHSHSSQAFRNYGLGAQVLKALKIHKIRLLTDQEIKPVALEGFDIEIAGFQKITPNLK
jgi:3,4-dihydroxy 2-butanone 4-phosphate synthase/GTP cyclohydrolase II